MAEHLDIAVEYLPGGAVNVRLGDSGGPSLVSGTSASTLALATNADGTIAFTRGIPLFTTIVALLVDDVPVVGMIDQSILRERWVGVAGCCGVGAGVGRGDGVWWP